MAESKVKSENFIVVQGWMLKELWLKGNELLIYACIYGFSQSDNQKYTGSLQYLADWTNSTKRTVLNSLQSLLDKGYIGKEEKYISGVKFCEYYVKKFTRVVKDFHGGMEKFSLGGSEEISPNNIAINNIDKNIVNRIGKASKEKSNIRIDYQKVIDCFNETCVSLPSVKTLSESRKKAIKGIFKKYSSDEIKEAFKLAESSDFLKGKNDRKWKANFDWIMKDANLAKILDGNYTEHRPINTAVQGDQTDLDDVF